MVDRSDTAAGLSARSGAGNRRGRGFARAAAATLSLARAAAKRRGFAERRLLADWPAVVGAEIAALCTPVRLSHGGRGGGMGATLVLAARPGRAPELACMSAAVIERVNAAYGYAAVGRVHLTQALAAPEPPAPPPPPPLDAPPSDRVSRIADDDLRARAALLERNILTASQRRRR